jgi:hypothetical protein
MIKDVDLKAVLTRLDQVERRLTKLEHPAADAPKPVSGKKLSAKEFLMTKTVGSELQRVVALAFYLERQERMASFNVSDLEAAFRSAREKLPKNMNDAVNKNIARGFLMEAAAKKDSKKAWQLTSTGERFVETGI